MKRDNTNTPCGDVKDDGSVLRGLGGRIILELSLAQADSGRGSTFSDCVLLIAEDTKKNRFCLIFFIYNELIRNLSFAYIIIFI